MCVDAQGPDGAGNALIQKDALNNFECFENSLEKDLKTWRWLLLLRKMCRANLCNYNSSTNHLDTLYISCRFLQYFVLELVISHSQLSNGVASQQLFHWQVFEDPFLQQKIPLEIAAETQYLAAEGGCIQEAKSVIVDIIGNNNNSSKTSNNLKYNGLIISEQKENKGTFLVEVVLLKLRADSPRVQLYTSRECFRFDMF